ncbi:MAG: hypothetical protein ACXVBG_23100 [Isosphaeraceae bacterium]
MLGKICPGKLVGSSRILEQLLVARRGLAECARHWHEHRQHAHHRTKNGRHLVASRHVHAHALLAAELRGTVRAALVRRPAQMNGRA